MCKNGQMVLFHQVTLPQIIIYITVVIQMQIVCRGKTDGGKYSVEKILSVREGMRGRRSGEEGEIHIV